MCAQKASFLQALRLPPDLSDEACARAISELISLAATAHPDAASLNDIHAAVVRYECAAYLEPLDVLPTLLPCRHDGAMDLLRTCALNNSAKEVTLVVQEAIEHVQTHLDDHEEEGDDPNLVQRAIGILSLCPPAVSRSRVGKRSALELCLPVLEDVASLVASVSPRGTREDGRALITGAAGLVQSLAVWAAAAADGDGLHAIKRLLRGLLDTTVVSCAPSIQASLAVRSAECYFFPRHVTKSCDEGWQDGQGAMHQVQRALECLGSLPLTTWTSLSDLVYLAHAAPPVALPPSALSDLHPLLVDALQTNTAVDESLFLLLRLLTHDNMTVCPDVAVSLCAVFKILASTHLDPRVRQLNLGLLSLTLTKLAPFPRLGILLRLTTDDEFPQIRGPAVGLVKEAVLEALASPADRSCPNPFGSLELLRVFGGVLFRPNPPGFLSEHRTREELARSLELLRLADCLSFYYVLLRRDRENRTGVRSEGNVASVQGSMLRPLRRFLDEHVDGKEPPLMALSSLQIGLDRVDGALRTLDFGREP